MNTKQLIKQNIEDGNDFNFYPTTNEILEVIKEDISSLGIKHLNFLDIGAGNCKIKSFLDEFISTYYAIEKSQTLISNFPDDVILVGTDFMENSLYNKEVDVIFCNPPYRDVNDKVLYNIWTDKIIKESNAKFIYLVIPQRWNEDKTIMKSIEDREAKYTSLGKFDFLNSEDRKARAYVELIRFDFSESNRFGRFRDILNVNPYDLMIDEWLEIDFEENEISEWKQNENRKESIKNEVVQGTDLIESLHKIMLKEQQDLGEAYQSISKIPKFVAKELGLNKENIYKGLKFKLKGLDKNYWNELFDGFEPINKRLTRESIRKLKNKFFASSSIDFTPSNARAIVIQVIKQAVNLTSTQLLEVHDKFTNQESIRLYKSNQRFNNNSFRYYRGDKLDLYKLDYRIIFSSVYPNYNNTIGDMTNDKLHDIFVIAKILGFNPQLGFNPKFGYSFKDMEYGKPSFNFMESKHPLDVGTKTNVGKIEEVFYIDDTKRYQYKIKGEYFNDYYVKSLKDVFVEAKVYKNGNLHLKFNQEFMKRFNIEVGKLRGWLKRPDDIADEFQMDIEEATRLFLDNPLKLDISKLKLLGNITI